MQVFSFLSIIMCLAVISVFFFSKNIRSKSYNKVVLFIAVSDLLTSFGGILGITKSGSLQCTFQAILTNLFPLSSMFWTTVIVYFLFDIVARTNPVFRDDLIYNWWLHLICWGLPSLLTFLPLVTEDYGTFDGDPGWCFLKSRPGSVGWTYEFWVIVSFYGWIYIAVVAYVVILCSVIYRLSSSSLRSSTDESSATHVLVPTLLLKLIWYPIIILVSWSVITIYVIWDAYNSKSARRYISDLPLFIPLTFSAPLLHGFLASLAFFLSSLESRRTLFSLPSLIWRYVSVSSQMPASRHHSNPQSKELISSSSLAQTPHPAPDDEAPERIRLTFGMANSDNMLDNFPESH